jgi:hypothetical protein
MLPRRLLQRDEEAVEDAEWRWSCCRRRSASNTRELACRCVAESQYRWHSLDLRKRRVLH